MGPRQYARYKAGKRVWDTRHYEGDKEQFEDEAGTVWTRVAVTVGMFEERARATQELDRLEAQGEASHNG